MERKTLWACPKCGKSFVTRNLWHSCGRYTVTGFLKAKGSRSRTLFNEFTRLVRKYGPIRISPSKTSVSFMARVRFAGVIGLSERGMTITFGLPKRFNHRRIQRIEHPVANWYVHYLRITSASELDEDLLRWLKESYRMVGEQNHLAAK